jgi:hypothetical protein
MKRDPDLVRQICFAVEDLEPGQYLQEVDGVDESAFAHHVALMIDAGLVSGDVVQMLGSTAHAHVERLTWTGHDFADAARSDTLWKKAKDNVIKPGASWSFDLLKEWLKAEVKNGFPTLR